MRKVVGTVLVAVGALVALIVAAVGGFAGWFYGRQAIELRRQSRERHRYTEWATEHGLEYAAQDEARLTSLVSANDAPLHVFHVAACRISHVFSRPTDPRESAFLELAVALRPGGRPTTYMTLAVARLSSPIGGTVIRPRTRGTAPDTTLVGDPAFDAAYLVRSDDPTQARAVLGPPLTEWLLAFPERARPEIRLQGEWAVWFGDGPLVFEPAKRGLDVLTGFLDRAYQRA